MKNRSGIPAHKLISGRKRICLKVSKSQNNSRKIENDVVIIGVYYWYKTDEIKAPEIN
jgi:hypothetical protein